MPAGINAQTPVCCGQLQAQSEFARSKTLAQQRKFLPVFECRDELLNLIRENSVVVVVGETGSGKTTQVRQPYQSDPRQLCITSMPGASYVQGFAML